MTAINDDTDAVASAGRESHRRELAELLDRDLGAIPDSAVLAGDLTLDSLAMMTLLTWLESRGIVVGDPASLTSVGDVLSLLDRKTRSAAASLRVIGDVPLEPPGPADLPPLPRMLSPLEPVLSNHVVSLTPIAQNDLDFLYGLAIQPETAYRWRYRDAPPSPERFSAEFWANVLVQFVARRTNGDHPVGHVLAYSADHAMRHAYIGAVFQPSFVGKGMAAQAVALFVRYLFHTFPFRKLYLEIPGFNWPELRSGEGRLFAVEGVLRNHFHYAGREWDGYLCAIYREHDVSPDEIH